MSTTSKILLGGAVLLGIGAYAYRRGIDNLQFSIAGYQPGSNGQLLMKIQVTNPNQFFGYPVPRMLVNAFDSSGSFIGTVINDQLQYIPARSVSYIFGVVSPNYANFFSIISNLISSGSLPTGINFHGIVQVGKFEIPFETSTAIAGNKAATFAAITALTPWPVL